MVDDSLHGTEVGAAVHAADFFFIENVGNLVCPAIYDLGQAANVVALSVTEGVDKPLKYPVMFKAADLVVLTKVDLAPRGAARAARAGGRIQGVASTEDQGPTRGSPGSPRGGTSSARAPGGAPTGRRSSGGQVAPLAHPGHHPDGASPRSALEGGPDEGVAAWRTSCCGAGCP